MTRRAHLIFLKAVSKPDSARSCRRKEAEVAGKCQPSASLPRQLRILNLLLVTSVILLGVVCRAAGQVATFTHDLSGSLTSVTQSVAAAPTITTSPVDQIISRNGNAFFSVLASGAGPLSFQWLSNGVPITGANSDVLVISNLVVSQNLLTNGGFELPPEGNTYVTYGPAANLGGWIVETGTVDHVFTFWEAAEGHKSIDLNGTSPGALYRDIPTAPGQQYYFHYALAGNYVIAPTTKTNEVWWNGSPIDTNIFAAAGHSATDMGWTNVEYLVTATDTSTRIRFASGSPGAGGSALDNVTLFPAPPPPPEFAVIVSNSSGSVTSIVATIQFDTDGNGLPDAWERQYLGSIGALPDDDADHDGVSNLEEFFDGTDPANASSLNPHLNLSVNGNGVVLVSPLKSAYSFSEIVQATAVPDPGNMFIAWYGPITNSNPVLTLTMTNSKAFTALFGLTLINGGNHFASVAPNGVTVHALVANTGDTLILRCGKITGTASFAPNIAVYNPAGALVATAANLTDAYLSYRTLTSGVFRVEISSYYAGESGTYRLTLAQSPETFVVPPGDEGGPLTNGVSHPGTTELGDEDLWSFTANSGDTIVLRAGKLSGDASYAPLIRLYATNGALLTSDANVNDAYVSYRTTNSGTFNVVVGGYYQGYTGTYQLTFAKAPGDFVVAPGDEGGALTNGGQHDGAITMGEEDLWSVAANAGDTLVLRCAKTAGPASFAPWVRLYATNGGLLASDQDVNDTYVSYRATNSGTFNVMVGAYFQGYTGTYRLRLAKVPGAFVIPPGDEGGGMAARNEL